MTEPNTTPDDELPPPALSLLITDNLDPLHSMQKGDAVSWIIGKPHPFMPSMKIEAMFVSRGAVAVYVYSSSDKTGSRDVIPMSRVRLAHEGMHLEILAEEIDATAAGDDPYIYGDKNDDDPDVDLGDPPAAETSPTNGQPSP